MPVIFTALPWDRAASTPLPGRW